MTQSVKWAKRIVGVCVVGIALAAGGQEAGKPDWVEKLISQLSSESWQDRQKAQDELVGMGLEVRERLKKLLRETTDEEVRTRAEAALRVLNEQASTGASIITLHMKNASPAAIFAEISKQAETDMRPTPANLWESRTWTGIDLDVDHQPFWVAMREICEKLQLGIQSSGLSREMMITDRNMMRVWGQAPSVVSGPFLFTANMINSHRMIDLNQPGNATRNCNIQMLVFVEPKIRVLQGSYLARIEEAVDENGKTLVGAPRVVSEAMQPPSNWYWNLSISLMPPADAGQKIASLKGKARFIIQTKAEKAEIADVLSARNVAKVVGGKRFTLKEVRKAGESYVVQMTLYRSGWSANEWMLMYPYNIFRLEDAKGNRLMRTGNAGGGGGGGDEANVNLTFARQAWQCGESAGEPAKLLWEVPTESKEVLVPFEFKDLPMP